MGRIGKDQEGGAKNLVFVWESTRKNSGSDQEGSGRNGEDPGVMGKAWEGIRKPWEVIRKRLGRNNRGIGSGQLYSANLKLRIASGQP